MSVFLCARWESTTSVANLPQCVNLYYKAVFTGKQMIEVWGRKTHSYLVSEKQSAWKILVCQIKGLNLRWESHIPNKAWTKPLFSSS